MFSFLLVIIYISFISLGLPDPLLGSAWPVMHTSLGVPLSYAGIISMLIAGSTIVSSLMSGAVNRRFGTGLVTAVSVLTTALALFGFSVAPSFPVLCILAVPYGLGAGAVDAALNNYVSLHYAARHMSWLHCFWGVGTSLSPFIMSFCLTRGFPWQAGYVSVAVLQSVLTAVLFFTLPLWKKPSDSAEEASDEAKSFSAVLRLRGVPFALITMLAYCALEATCGLWASSFLSEFRGVSAESAARFASLFYLGITFGRLVSGFVSERLGDRKMIRIGIGIVFLGIVCVAAPVESDLPSLWGLVVIGVGCAPIYPSVIHATPQLFGRENSGSVIGLEMAFAMTGVTFMPSVFGFISDHLSLGAYPFFLGVFAILMFASSEALNRIMKK